MFAHILVAVDGSTAGAAALQTAIALAHEQHAQLRLVHVVQEAAAYAIDNPLVDIARLDDAWCAAGQHVLDGAAAAAQAAGLVPETALLEDGLPGEAIVREAARWGADLIVTGTHGRRGVRRLVLGSVAEGVAQRSPVPVLLIRGT